MTMVEINRKLTAMGIRLQDQNPRILKCFYYEILDKQFSVEQTAQAFHFFRAGYVASREY